jgi:hypothetical protein
MAAEAMGSGGIGGVCGGLAAGAGASAARAGVSGTSALPSTQANSSNGVMRRVIVVSSCSVAGQRLPPRRSNLGHFEPGQFSRLLGIAVPGAHATVPKAHIAYRAVVEVSPPCAVIPELALFSGRSSVSVRSWTWARDVRHGSPSVLRCALIFVNHAQPCSAVHAHRSSGFANGLCEACGTFWPPACPWVCRAIS